MKIRALLTVLGVVLALSLTHTVMAEEVDRDTCLGCHQDAEGTTPKVDVKLFDGSVHKAVKCNACHADITEVPHPEKLKKVECAKCHQNPAADFAKGIHAEMASKNVPDVPTCVSCHGTHDIYPKTDLRSRTNHLQVDATCLKCHGSADITQRHAGLPSAEWVMKYERSVHGRGIHFKGLIVSATCPDCHGAHSIRPKTDPTSSVARSNIPFTCSKCHQGIYKDYEESTHGQQWKAGNATAPVCITCHKSHEISEPSGNAFQLRVADECGECHKAKAKSYGDTFHGKATSLGFVLAAKCSDCHTPHHNLPKNDRRSSVYPDQLPATCGKCHPGATPAFVQYNPHLDAEDKNDSPLAYYVLLLMKMLLLGTFSFFGLHTLLWFQRAVVSMVRKEHQVDTTEGRYVRRFSSATVGLHIVIVCSFLCLAATGLPLKYHYSDWATTLGSVFGGIEVARYFHRVCAIITFGYATFHVCWLFGTVITKKQYHLLFGPDSLVPRPKDAEDLLQNLKWFLYMGHPPKYGRWTYFEKFDYFAVFWGIPVIGFSGLVMWFPGFFTRFVPGTVLNLATIIHGEEAMLAVGFIFTMHFFHNHLRPENFPMDISVFTGKITLARFRLERPEEYEFRLKTNTLQELLVEPPTRAEVHRCTIFGSVALAIGCVLILCIFYALLF